MVKPGKEAAASGGRAKAAVNAFSVPERTQETLTQRIPLGNGGYLIKFPSNWHKKMSMVKERPQPDPTSEMAGTA